MTDWPDAAARALRLLCLGEHDAAADALVSCSADEADKIADACKTLRRLAGRRLYESGPGPGDGTCVLCERRHPRRCRDHCHIHGLNRGIVCPSCNTYMAMVDRGIRPKSTPFPIDRFVDYAARCVACPPLDPSRLRHGTFGPNGSWTPIPAQNIPTIRGVGR